MKFIFLLMLCLSFSCFASEIRVKKMLKDGELDRSYILKTNLTEKVVLDCQSFIQGLRIGEYEEAYTYLLDPFECEDLQDRIKKTVRKSQEHCIDAEEDIRADYACQH